MEGDGPAWEVSCIAGVRLIVLARRGTALKAARAGLDRATAAHPELTAGSWLILTTNRHDGRVNRYGWRVVDDGKDEGTLVEVRREFWVETTPRTRKRM
jgi:hypothetical protein